MACDVNTPTLILEEFFFFAVSVLGTDSQLLVYSHTMILNAREGRVLEAEGR